MSKMTEPKRQLPKNYWCWKWQMSKLSSLIKVISTRFKLQCLVAEKFARLNSFKLLHIEYNKKPVLANDKCRPRQRHVWHISAETFFMNKEKFHRKSFYFVLSFNFFIFLKFYDDFSLYKAYLSLPFFYIWYMIKIVTYEALK